MKKLWLVSILLIVVLSVVCILWYFQSRTGGNGSGGRAIAKPEAMAHLPLIGLRQSGSVLIGRLESPMVIDGYPCDASWVHFNQAGRLKAFYLSDACSIQGNRIPKGTWIQLHPDQTVRFCSFPEDTVIQGHLCDGGSGGAEGVTTSFYPSGKLGGFYSPQDVEIQGIPCRASPINGIGLHENGNLETFTLARDTVIGGRSLSAGQRVVLDAQGNVKSVEDPPIYERPLAWITKMFPGH
jgi:hypothetical protein